MKEILLDVARSLETSTSTSWSSGYVEEFSAWAKKMRATINTAVPILRTTANSIELLNSRIAELEKQLVLKDEIILRLTPPKYGPPQRQ